MTTVLRGDKCNVAMKFVPCRGGGGELALLVATNKTTEKGEELLLDYTWDAGFARRMGRAADGSLSRGRRRRRRRRQSVGASSSLEAAGGGGEGCRRKPHGPAERRSPPLPALLPRSLQ